MAGRGIVDWLEKGLGGGMCDHIIFDTAVQELQCHDRRNLYNNDDNKVHPQRSKQELIYNNKQFTPTRFTTTITPIQIIADIANGFVSK